MSDETHVLSEDAGSLPDDVTRVGVIRSLIGSKRFPYISVATWIAIVAILIGVIVTQYSQNRGLTIELVRRDAEIFRFSWQREVQNAEIQRLRALLQGTSRDVDTVSADGNSASPLTVTITISSLPRPGPDGRGRIAGSVAGLNDPQRMKLVLYSLTDHWYIQPFTSQPFTDIDGEGNWESRVHPGDSYAAVLVEPPYSPALLIDALPETNGGVIAVVTASGLD